MSITCPCGTVFEKAPGRGRPPKFCPSCRASGNRPVVSVEGEPECREGFTPKGRVYDPHDTLTPSERDRVEDGIEEVDAKYRYEIWPNRATLWPNLSELDQVSACYRWHQEAMTDVYKKVNPKWYQRRGGDK